MPVSRLRSIALGVAPLLVLILGTWLLFKLDAWQHLRGLPGGYESFSTAHFQVHYPSGYEARAQSVVSEAEAFLNDAPVAFEGLLGDLSPPKRRIRLTLFKNHDAFTAFAQSSLSEDMSSNGGYFDAARLEIVLVLTEDNIDNLGIRHEVAHLLVARGGGRFGTTMPRWLNEGLATWLETADLQAPGSSGPIVGWVQLIAAAYQQRPKLKEVLQYDDQSFRSAENDRAYAYANLLVHFLVDIDRNAFFSFAKDVRDAKRTHEKALTHHFGPLNSLDHRFSTYVDTLVREFDRQHRDAIIRGQLPPLH